MPRTIYGLRYEVGEDRINPWWGWLSFFASMGIAWLLLASLEPIFGWLGSGLIVIAAGYLLGESLRLLVILIRRWRHKIA